MQVALALHARACLACAGAASAAGGRGLHCASALLARAKAPRLAATAQPVAYAGSSDAVTNTDDAETSSAAPSKPRGAHYNARSGKWTSSITSSGVKQHLGTFDSAAEAAAAYAAALAAKGRGIPLRSVRAGRITGRVADDSGTGRQVLITREEAERLGLLVTELHAPPAAGGRELAGEGEESSTGHSEGAQQASGAVDASHSPYLGVLLADLSAGLRLWEAVYTLPDGKEVSGGEYETEKEAAKAYDALARMYGGESARTNFPADAYSAWLPPDEIITTGQIETLPGQPLTAEEITAALRQERGGDVRLVELAGRSDLAEALVFATGKSVPHMRKMADTISRALRKRRLPTIDDPSVENREGDDWMVVDCGNIIVNIMDAESREVFGLEAFYEGMKLGVDPYEGLTYDEWLEQNPIPDKWLARLEKDEVEMKALKHRSSPLRQGGNAVGVSSGRSWAVPGGGRVNLSEGSGGKGAGRRGAAASAHHFPAKLKAKPKT